MTDDLISLEDAIEVIASVDITDGTEPVFSGKQVIALLKDLDTITPQEQKTGHWIGIDEEPHEDYECDNCGYVVSTYTANIKPHTEYKYCPNCGARMESEG